MATTAAAHLLVEIRRRYSAAAGDLRLSIENDSEGWRADIAERGQAIYSARRCSVSAAKLALADYLAFRMPASAAQPLRWIESW